MVLGWELPWSGAPTGTHRTVSSPCRHRVSGCFLLGFCSCPPFFPQCEVTEVGLPFSAPPPNCQFSVHQASRTFWHSGLGRVPRWAPSGSRNGRWPWSVSQSQLETVPRAKFRPLILNPVLFQYHTASEPVLGTLQCFRFLSFPQSQLWSFIPGHGDKPLLPSQVPLSLPLPRPARRFSCCVLLLHPGGQGCLHAGLASP